MAKDDYAAYVPPSSEDNEETASKELKRELSSMPVIQDVLDWFDTQIAELKDPSLITGISESTPAEEIKERVLFAKLQIQEYEIKRDSFISEFNHYIQDEPM